MIIGKCPVCGGDMRVGSDMTNADRIRGMTDDELAEFLEKTQKEAWLMCTLSKKGWLDWVKKEVEHET